MKTFTLCLLLLFVEIPVFFSCSGNKSEREYTTLVQLDLLIEKDLALVDNSLSGMESDDLSPANRNYYYLLKTIVDDKQFVSIESDSLINEVELYYRRHNFGEKLHIRSLIYQGIVRFRMGGSDSTVFEPFKEALTMLKQQDAANGEFSCLAVYYLGCIHESNGDDDDAEAYFRRALQLAKQNNMRKQIFHIYQALWRVKMKGDAGDAESYLDTLALYTQSAEEQYYALNAQAVFLNVRQEYVLAVEKEKALLSQAFHLGKEEEYYRIYYSLSNSFYNLNLLDSALYYIRQSIAHIPNPYHKLNYLLYDHAADVAYGMSDFRMADDYRSQALRAFEQTVEERIKNNIRELEIKYDHAETENRALRAEAYNRRLFTLGIILSLLIIILSLYFARERVVVLLQNEKMSKEKQKIESEAFLLRQQTESQKRLISYYLSFIKIYGLLVNRLRELSKKIHSKDIKLGDEFDKTLKEGRRNFNHLAKEMISPEDMTQLFGIGECEDILNHNDRLFLFMLSSGADNEEIAAIFNTSTVSLKAKKWQLKEKIIDRANDENKLNKLLEIISMT